MSSDESKLLYARSGKQISEDEYKRLMKQFDGLKRTSIIEMLSR